MGPPRSHIVAGGNQLRVDEKLLTEERVSTRNAIHGKSVAHMAGLGISAVGAIGQLGAPGRELRDRIRS